MVSGQKPCGGKLKRSGRKVLKEITLSVSLLTVCLVPNNISLVLSGFVKLCNGSRNFFTIRRALRTKTFTCSHLRALKGKHKGFPIFYHVSVTTTKKKFHVYPAVKSSKIVRPAHKCSCESRTRNEKKLKIFFGEADTTRMRGTTCFFSIIL